jgi:hypothetical protein
MKKQAYTIATMIMLIVVGGLSSVKAQNSNGTVLRVDIPFAFSVGNKTLPAGKYDIHCVNTASPLKILQLRDESGRTSVLVRTSSIIGKTQDNARLVFNRYGDRYFFAQAWLPADNTGMQAPKSRSERATANELASIRRATETVALTMKR